MPTASAPDSWTFLTCDALEKVFDDTPPRPMDPDVGYSVFLGEPASFQIAFQVPQDADLPVDLHVTLDERSAPLATVRRVDPVLCPVTKQEFDEHYLRTTSGRYPDLLTPAPDGVVQVTQPGWQAVWVDVVVDSLGQAGPLPVTARVSTGATTLYEDTVLVNVLPRRLPPLRLEHTQWFHVDALADYYQVPVFSEAHWDIIDRFLGSAASLGVNTLLTPTWTPPLDTAVGSYRTPVQLIDVRLDRGVYSFDFTRLHRWMDLARAHSIRTLEIAHFFSQWGATRTPAVYTLVDGEQRRLFGWDVPATDERYREFLAALVPQLLEVLEREWDLNQVLFHISDEPHGTEQLDTYRAARELVAPLLAGLRVVDALSDLDYYAQGLVSTPVAANTTIEPFLAAEVDPLWTYYCMAQQVSVSNRFIALPSVRNRILAPQLFKGRIRGFLHWGFNFYYSELSASLIDPFRDTTASGAFPGGDSFIVYPGPGGRPLESIRYRVLQAAMNDLRAMEMLESLRGRQAVLKIIDPQGTLTFSSFSYDATAYRAMRERLNAAVMAC